MTSSQQWPDRPNWELDPDLTYSLKLGEYHRQVLERVRTILPAAALELKAAGVTRLEAYYDGCGDSGQIDTVRFYAADHTVVDLVGRVSFSEQSLKDLFYDLLEVRHGGWENNDGGYGEFHWNLLEGSVHHTHNDRYTDYDTTEHDGL